MMLKTLILLALVALAIAKVDYTGYRVFRAHPSLEQFDTIKSLQEKYNLDIWSEYRYEGDFIDFMVGPSLLSVVETTLKHFRIQYDTFIEDVEVSARAQFSKTGGYALDTFDYDVYHKLDEIYAWMDDMVAAYDNVEIVPVGTSYEKRPIIGLKITSASGTNGDSSFVINCGIHSREWVSPATCLLTAQWLVESEDASVKSLLSAIDFYIVPSANPDGYVYTWEEDRMWRKTRSVYGNNCDGADPNRNFDDHWGEAGTSPLSCSDIYPGPHAFSEIESKAHAAFVGSIKNAKAYIDIHAYSQLWMYPYGYTTSKCQDDAILGEIASDSVAAIFSVNRETYQSGPIATTIYEASGSTSDYIYDHGITCAFAAELRDTGTFGFLLPARFIRPTAEETVAGLKVIAQAVVDGKCG